MRFTFDRISEACYFPQLRQFCYVCQFCYVNNAYEVVTDDMGMSSVTTSIIVIYNIVLCSYFLDNLPFFILYYLEI